MIRDMETLEAALSSLDAALLQRLSRAGFDRSRFLELAATLRQGDAAVRRRTRNTVRGTVEPPRAGEIAPLAAEGSEARERLRARGLEAMRNGELAFASMAGGMATRMGGIVKALAEVIPGHTFLSMRLSENRHASELAARTIPFWIMTSEATHETIVDALAKAGAGAHVAAFMQNLSLRLSPDGSLFRDAAGKPSVYATGHGDFVDALRRSKLLDTFVDGGGKYVWITNIDNLGASIDPVLLGHFIESEATVMCEVTGKDGDRGGIPVHAEGKLQVLEEFRLPPDFDARRVDVFNTNTFLVRAEPLLRAPLSWTFFEVEKQVDGRTAIQFERLIQEITAHLPSTFLQVPREGALSRFLPVKDFDELGKRRPTIEVVARGRGMV